jgi:hypothetical protein
MRGRLRRPHLGNRARVTDPPRYFFIELGLEMLKRLLGYVGIHAGSEALPNFFDCEVKEQEARIVFSSGEIDNITVLPARACCLELLQVFLQL